MEFHTHTPVCLKVKHSPGVAEARPVPPKGVAGGLSPSVSYLLYNEELHIRVGDPHAQAGTM